MAERVRFGVLGAAWIADRAVIPALHAAANASPVAIGSREPQRARDVAARHGINTVHPSYESLLADPQVEAVYVALVNSAHREWVLRALAAGKHVLCEKPLAVNGAEAREMADASRRQDRVLMEAFMYRFHPRMVALRNSTRDVTYLHAAFSLTLTMGGNHTREARIGGGALLDVGCYTLDVARWFLGEPQCVRAVMTGDGVDTAAASILDFANGEQATTWVSFIAPQHQVLDIVSASGSHHVTQPFTASREPHDPYQLMVEAFSESVLRGTAPPISLEDSIGTADLMDRVRQAAGCQC